MRYLRIELTPGAGFPRSLSFDDGTHFTLCNFKGFVFVLFKLQYLLFSLPNSGIHSIAQLFFIDEGTAEKNILEKPFLKATAKHFSLSEGKFIL